MLYTCYLDCGLLPQLPQPDAANAFSFFFASFRHSKSCSQNLTIGESFPSAAILHFSIIEKFSIPAVSKYDVLYPKTVWSPKVRSMVK